MTDATPMISIGLPIFNCRHWLGPTIESILEQTEADIELIISDNASTDDSYSLAQSFAARDPRIRLHRQTSNIGAPGNYRFVARQARGRYFKWAAASDLISPNFVAECAGVLDRMPAGVVCYGSTKLFTDSRADGRDYDDGINLRMADPVQRFIGVLDGLRLNNVINGVIRREALLTTSIMPNYYSCDVVVLAELALLGYIIQQPAAIFYRRMTAETATRLKDKEEVRRHYYPQPRAGMLFQEWQLCAGYLSAVLRAPVTPSQRTRLLQRTLKLCYWNLPRLWDDVLQAGRSLVSGRS